MLIGISFKEGKIGYYQIIRANGNLRRYSSMIQMLKSFDKEDLETLWKLVKAKHGYTRPEEGYERVLWDKYQVWRIVGIKSLLEVTVVKVVRMLLLLLVDAESLVYIRRSAAKTKDKGKGIMEESESAMTKTKRQQEQERLGLETAVRLQEEFDEEERQRIARVHEAARSFSEVEWEDIRARVEASEELVQRLQTEEREKYSEDDQAKMLVDLINQRKRYFAAQKAEAKRNKPMTQAQQRTYMSNYIKHMGNYKLQQLKRLSFDEIKDLFETTMRRANTFVPMETKIRRGVPDSKKQKSDELSQEELQQLIIIVPKERMNIEALQTKYPIIDWEVYTEDSRMFNSTEPTEDKEIEIWVELKRLFEPDADDELWKSQKHIHDITWILYDTCGVHHISTKDRMDIYMLVEREYPLSRGVLTQMLVAKLLVEQDNEMSRELLRRIFMQIERPRR
ncbi:hypothetical protein Tco_1368993 [Tanacetum coccineum]